MQRLILAIATIVYIFIAAAGVWGAQFLSASKAQATSEETSNRLLIGSRSLESNWKNMAMQRRSSLAATVENPDVQKTLLSLTAFDREDQSMMPLLKSVRVAYFTKLMKDYNAAVADDDLIIVRTNNGICWADNLLADFARSGNVGASGFGELDAALSDAGTMHFAYVVDSRTKVGNAYMLSAVEQVVSAPDAETQVKVTVAFGQRLTDAMMTDAAALAGVDVSAVADKTTAASSLLSVENRALVAAADAISGCGAQGVVGGIGIDRFPQLPPLPIEFPLFVDGVFDRDVTSHGGCTVEAPGLSGMLVLTTRMDGLMELSNLQRNGFVVYAIVLIVGLIVLGIMWSVKGGKGVKTDNVTIRKVPIAGQDIPLKVALPRPGNAADKPAGGAKPASGGTASPSALDDAASPLPAAVDDLPPVPVAQPAEAAELSPDDFNFGDSPIASSGDVPSNPPEAASDSASDAEAAGEDEGEGDSIASIATDSLGSLDAAVAAAAAAVDASSSPDSPDEVDDAPLFDETADDGTLVDESASGMAEVQPVSSEDAPAYEEAEDRDATTIAAISPEALSAAMSQDDSFYEEASPAAAAPEEGDAFAYADDASGIDYAGPEPLDAPIPAAAASPAAVAAPYPAAGMPADGGDGLFNAVADDAEAALDALFPGQAYEAAAGQPPMDPNGFYDQGGMMDPYAAQGMDPQGMDPNAVYAQGAYPEGYDPASAQAYADGQAYGADQQGYYADGQGYADGQAYADGQGYGAGYADPDEQHFMETYQNFVAIRSQCGEVGEVDYAAFIEKLRANRDQVMMQFGCASVRFEAYAKDGRASLKATPVM